MAWSAPSSAPETVWVATNPGIGVLLPSSFRKDPEDSAGDLVCGLTPPPPPPTRVFGCAATANFICSDSAGNEKTSLRTDAPILSQHQGNCPGPWVVNQRSRTPRERYCQPVAPRRGRVYAGGRGRGRGVRAGGSPRARPGRRDGGPDQRRRCLPGRSRGGRFLRTLDRGRQTLEGGVPEDAQDGPRAFFLPAEAQAAPPLLRGEGLRLLFREPKVTPSALLEWRTPFCRRADLRRRRGVKTRRRKFGAGGRWSVIRPCAWRLRGNRCGGSRTASPISPEEADAASPSPLAVVLCRSAPNTNSLADKSEVLPAPAPGSHAPWAALP